MSLNQIKGFFTKRDRILRYLLLKCSASGSECTLKEIAEAVKLSPTGARHYLIMLENEGVISRSEIQGRSGRPATTYFLTDTGMESFPKAYTNFGISLLEEVRKKYGREEMINLLENIGKKRALVIKVKMNETIGTDDIFVSTKKVLEELVHIFEENGKFPELVEEKESFIFKNHNCLYYNIAMQEPLVCKVTETMMNELTNGVAVKEKCIRDGGEACFFRIKKQRKK